MFGRQLATIHPKYPKLGRGVRVAIIDSGIDAKLAAELQIPQAQMADFTVSEKTEW